MTSVKDRKKYYKLGIYNEFYVLLNDMLFIVKCAIVFGLCAIFCHPATHYFYYIITTLTILQIFSNAFVLTILNFKFVAMTPRCDDVMTYRHDDAAMRRRAQCVDASTFRRVVALIYRRGGASSCRNVEATTHRHVDASAGRRVGASTHRHVDASMR